MGQHSSHSHDAHSSDETAVRALYQQLLDGWNQRNPDAYASLFTETGEVIGFDGSLMTGPVEIATTLQHIFATHMTAAYVGKIKRTFLLSTEVAIVHAIAGMTPPGQPDLNPAVNAHHTLIAVKRESQWRIQLFQNTPAQFHGQPDLVEQMTQELRQVRDSGSES